MDDEAETYKLWRIRKTVMQVIPLNIGFLKTDLINVVYSFAMTVDI